MYGEVIGDAKRGMLRLPQKAQEWLQERAPGRIFGE